MTKSESNEITNKVTIAVYPFGIEGLLIKDIIHGIDDFVQYVTSFDGRSHTAKINYNGDRPYFRYGANRIYFDECMRV